MNLLLPPRTDGSRMELEVSGGRIVIIGANGAGKTRFARRMAADAAPKAIALSALGAIFPSASGNEIDSLDSLLSRLMHDEMLNLLSYKLSRAEKSRPCDTPLPVTALDRVVSHWQEIFPDNRVLIESGKMLFGRGVDPDAYSSLRLSTGEKAVLYYLAALSYAPDESVVFVDNPDMFLHPSLTGSLWNRLELMRPDCTFVYITHDLDFAASRTGAEMIWVRDCDVTASTWDYDIFPRNSIIPDQAYLAILGSRKPILFIEGDSEHSIDAKLYPLIFRDYTVKPLGSCNKVIESTRSFNDLSDFHHLDSHGIVDRDRRDAHEVEYLRRKKIFVPEVAEIENILMLEDVVKAVAASRGKREEYVAARVKDSVISLFKANLRQQALQHTRHRVKRFMEYRTDGRFSDIGMLERHLDEMVVELNPRGLYEDYCREFHRYVDTADYQAVLRVFNQKSMVSSSNVAQLCGIPGGREEYVAAIIDILSRELPEAERIRNAILRCFGLPGSEPAEVSDAGTTLPKSPVRNNDTGDRHHSRFANHNRRHTGKTRHKR